MDTRGERRRFRWLCSSSSLLVLVRNRVRRVPPANTGRSRSNRSGSRSIPSGAREPRPGYLPVRFDITNLGEARVIEIVGQGTRFFRALEGQASRAASTSGRPCGWREAIACG